MRKFFGIASLAILLLFFLMPYSGSLFSLNKTTEGDSAGWSMFFFVMFLCLLFAFLLFSLIVMLKGSASFPWKYYFLSLGFSLALIIVSLWLIDYSTINYNGVGFTLTNSVYFIVDWTIPISLLLSSSVVLFKRVFARDAFGLMWRYFLISFASLFILSFIIAYVQKFNPG